MKKIIQTVYLKIKNFIIKKDERVVVKMIKNSKGESEFVRIIDEDTLAGYDRAYNTIDECEKQARKMKPSRLQKLAGISIKE